MGENPSPASARRAMWTGTMARRAGLTGRQFAGDAKRLEVMGKCQAAAAAAAGISSASASSFSQRDSAEALNLPKSST